MRGRKKQSRFVVSIALSLAMAFAWLPASANAQETAPQSDNADTWVQQAETTETLATSERNEATEAVEAEGIAAGQEKVQTNQEQGLIEQQQSMDDLEQPLTKPKKSANADALNQQADVSGPIPFSASKLDDYDTRIIFQDDERVSFFTNIISQDAYIINTYDLSSGQLTEDVVFKYKDKGYYCEEDHTLYTLKTSRASGSNGEYVFTPNIETFNLQSHQKNTMTLAPITSKRSNNLVSALGVDSKGRIYLATYDKVLYLYSPDGTLISQGTYEDTIYDFFGFDGTNGNFYYRGYTNWVYWGYDHEMASMMAGNVSSSGKITVAGKNLMQLFQIPFYYHSQCVQMFHGKYLAALSIFSGGKAIILDSNQYDISDYTQQQTTIHVIDSSVETSLLNIANVDAIKTQLTTAASNFSNDIDISSSGPRCTISEDGKTLIAKTDSNILTKYDLENNKKLLQVETAHEVYAFGTNGNTCIALERDGSDLYVEKIDWTLPDTFQVSVSDSELMVGETAQVIATADTNLQLTYKYESSYPQGCSVDSRGQLSAWEKGGVFITVTCTELGKQKTVQVKVADSELSQSQTDYSFCNTNGAVSTNIHLPYTRGLYGSVTRSYLAKAGEDLIRVEVLSGKVLVETYSKDFKLKSTRKLEMELPRFGGFFSGEDGYYLAFGKDNPKESDSAEVFRFVKYDKDWNRIGDCKVKGANTYIPFDAGGLDMCERNGMLYIHTCHEMYADSSGVHHQANCDFKINEADMSLADSYTGVMNLGEGYVSHSFQQKVCADENMLYRADLGDYIPRGISLTGTLLNKKFSAPSIYGTVVTIPTGGFQNYTGYALGGLECSQSSYIIAGCGIKNDYEETRNVFVSASYKDSLKTNVTWLTTNAEGSDVNVNTPKLVKLNDNQFLILWEEFKGSSYRTRMALLGPDGTRVSQIYGFPLALSDCEPIVDDEGYVVWYVTDYSSPAFFKFNPYRLKDAYSHIRQDGPPLIIQNVSAMAVNLSATKLVYNGKARKPKASIYGLTAGEDFTVTYKNNVKVGKATVTVTGKGNFTGKKTKTFKIVPKGTSISKLTPRAKAITVKWKKQAVQTSGYEIMLATNSKFTAGKKTVKITKPGTVSKKITKLKAKKKYYVKIRTYKIVGGVKYYSSWSAKKTVKTK